MSDNFSKALQKGIRSSNVAKKNKVAIDGVLNDLNVQIGRVTQNKILIEVRQSNLHRMAESLQAYVDVASGQADVARAKRVKDAYLVAQNINSRRVVNLAKWSQDPNGFPCRVETGERVFICDNKETLEKALEQTLEDPVVAEEIYTLTQAEE